MFGPETSRAGDVEAGDGSVDASFSLSCTVRTGPADRSAGASKLASGSAAGESPLCPDRGSGPCAGEGATGCESGTSLIVDWSLSAQEVSGASDPSTWLPHSGGFEISGAPPAGEVGVASTAGVPSGGGEAATDPVGGRVGSEAATALGLLLPLRRLVLLLFPLLDWR
jgi:hypothetical protein